jgi:hypothetical protein
MGWEGKKKKKNTLDAGPTAPPRVPASKGTAAARTTRAASAAMADSSEEIKKRRRNKNVLDDEQFPCTCGGVAAFNAAKRARQEAGGSGRGGKPSCLKNADKCTRGTELKRLKEGKVRAQMVD